MYKILIRNTFFLFLIFFLGGCEGLDIAVSFKDQYGKGRVYALNQIDERVYFESIKLFKSNHPYLWKLLIKVYEEAKNTLHACFKELAL